MLVIQAEFPVDPDQRDEAALPDLLAGEPTVTRYDVADVSNVEL